MDGSNGNVFVGCSDGKLYGFTSTGAALTTPSVTVGDGTATGGIVDPPLIDASNELVYVVAGSAGGGTEIAARASTVDLSSAASVTSPAFNFIEYNINSFPSADPPSGGAGSTGATFATPGPGTSGIIVDNAAAASQASSIYYGDLGTAHNAVKLTQGDLQ